MRKSSSRRRSWLFACVTAALGVTHPSRDSLAESQEAPAAARAPVHSPREQQQYCSNIAASVEAARIARQQKLLTEMEAQLSQKLAALEAKQVEVAAQLDKLESFERKTNDALVAFYTGMQPDAAAAQLAELDDDIAAALLLRLKAKAASAILNEMNAARGAALAKRIAQQRPANDGKKP